MKKEITQTMLKILLNYDPITGAFTWKVSAKKNKTCKIGDNAGTVVNNGYVRIGICGSQYAAHRLAFLYMDGSFPSKNVDHINHIKTDNSYNNLRLATPSENLKNIEMNGRNKSGVFGVSKNKESGKWRSQVKVSGKMIYLGQHDDYFEAVCARKSANNRYNFHENHGRTLR